MKAGSSHVAVVLLAVTAFVLLAPRPGAALEPKYRDWLDITKPLLTKDDLSRFLQLSAPERDQFIREFWKRHS